MCGIIGYIGEAEAAPMLLNGLKKMEYRGYDSAGIATISNSKISVIKNTGKISEINSKIDFLGLRGIIGIAHTRWATHGAITPENCHPHISCDSNIAIVHNGIIDNHRVLRESLESEGHRFKSDTDSEVIAHLIEKHYNEGVDEKKAVLDTVNLLCGSFAFVTIFASNPDVMIGARKDAPLMIGLGKHGNFLSSDTVSFIDHTDRVIFIDNFEIVILKGSKIQIFTFAGEKIQKEVTQVAWEAKDTSKEDFAHFTLKEIYEQPHTLMAALFQDRDRIAEICSVITKSKYIHITACGTSYHAGLLFKGLLGKMAKIRSDITISSEFSHEVDFVEKDSLVIALSQSGETADVLSAVSEAKKSGAKVFSITNVIDSSLNRESDMKLFINCGPEIGVAATKSFTSQLALIYLLVLSLLGDDLKLAVLQSVAGIIEKTLKSEEKVISLASKYKDCNDFYFVGRSLHFPIALEGALKLKELAYNHAEGMAGGELKHGTLALIERGTPVVVLNPEDGTYYEMLSNASEMKARGAKIIGISNKPNDVYDEFIQIPMVDDLFYPLVEVVPLQLLAYHMAVMRQRNPDYPRNLAKSVTVK